MQIFLNKKGESLTIVAILLVAISAAAVSSYFIWYKSFETQTQKSIGLNDIDKEMSKWGKGETESSGVIPEIVIGQNALTFDGTNDYIKIPKSISLNTPNAITIEAWVNTNNNNITTKIVQKGDWDGHGLGQDKWQGWQCHITLEDKGAKINWGKGLPQKDRWYYLAMTYDGNKLIFYVDGSKVSETEITGKIKSNSRDVYIGSDGGTQKFFQGTIDQVSFYNRSLSPEEILSHYNKQYNPNDTGLVGRWTFDDISGNVVTDSSGNGNNGTIFGK
jgi:hypothetical protein